MFANDDRTYIGGGPELFPVIRNIACTSLLASLVERLTGKNENAALSVEPSVFMDPFLGGLRRACLDHSQKFVVAIRRLSFHRGERADTR